MRLKTLLTLIEIDIKKILLWLIGIMLVVTALSTWVTNGIIGDLNRSVLEYLSGSVESTVSSWIAENGYMTLANVFTHWNGMLIGVIYMFGAFGVIGLSQTIWNKEWKGKSKRIYLLLSLKGFRFTIWIAKLATILMAVSVYVGSLFVNLGIASLLLRFRLLDGVVGNNLIQSALQSGSPTLGFVLPINLRSLLYRLLFVIFLFTLNAVAVLLQRSFNKRWLGFIVGVVYSGLFIAALIITQNLWLFYDERLWVDFGFLVFGTAVSTGLSYYLLNKKISV